MTIDIAPLPERLAQSLPAMAMLAELVADLLGARS